MTKELSVSKSIAKLAPYVGSEIMQMVRKLVGRLFDDASSYVCQVKGIQYYPDTQTIAVLFIMSLSPDTDNNKVAITFAQETLNRLEKA